MRNLSGIVKHRAKSYDARIAGYAQGLKFRLERLSSLSYELTMADETIWAPSVLSRL